MARSNGPNIWYGSDKEAKNWVCARPNRPKIGMSEQGWRDPNTVQTIIEGHTLSPARNPSPSGPHSFWSRNSSPES